MLKEARCPTCRQLSQWDGNAYRPFCSKRCKLLDLGNWASERYRVPSEPADAVSDEDGADDDDTELH